MVEGPMNIQVIIYENNGTVILIPKKNWNGQETLVFYANDSRFEIFEEIKITVIPVNDPPEQVKIIKPNHKIE